MFVFVEKQENYYVDIPLIWSYVLFLRPFLHYLSHIDFVLFRLYIPFNNFSAISGRCLGVAGSLTEISCPRHLA